MIRSRRFLTAALSTFLLGTAAPVVAADMGEIPPDPAAVYAKLAKMSLADAMKVAEQKSGGRASSAVLDFAGGQVKVTVAKADGSNAVVVVSLENGAIVSEENKGRFPGEPVKGEWTETGTGLKYFDLVVGKGELPPSPSARVEVHYTGWLVDGTKFDSSVDRGQTTTFALNQVIPGWTEGLQTMRVGGKRKLIIPAELGYGARGAGGVIPPNATLVFDVELVALP